VYGNLPARQKHLHPCFIPAGPGARGGQPRAAPAQEGGAAGHRRRCALQVLLHWMHCCTNIAARGQSMRDCRPRTQVRLKTYSCSLYPEPVPCDQLAQPLRPRPPRGCRRSLKPDGCCACVLFLSCILPPIIAQSLLTNPKRKPPAVSVYIDLKPAAEGSAALDLTAVLASQVRTRVNTCRCVWLSAALSHRVAVVRERLRAGARASRFLRAFTHARLASVCRTAMCGRAWGRASCLPASGPQQRRSLRG